MKKIKTSRQLERHLKGIANHYRIEILFIIEKNKLITLKGIIEIIGANEKTIGEHVRRLCTAGLVNKKYNDRFVEHSLSPYGQTFIKFLKSFRDL